MARNVFWRAQQNCSAENKICERHFNKSFLHMASRDLLKSMLESLRSVKAEMEAGRDTNNLFKPIMTEVQIVGSRKTKRIVDRLAASAEVLVYLKKMERVHSPEYVAKNLYASCVPDVIKWHNVLMQMIAASSPDEIHRLLEEHKPRRSYRHDLPPDSNRNRIQANYAKAMSRVGYEMLYKMKLEEWDAAATTAATDNM